MSKGTLQAVGIAALLILSGIVANWDEIAGADHRYFDEKCHATGLYIKTWNGLKPVRMCPNWRDDL